MSSSRNSWEMLNVNVVDGVNGSVTAANITLTGIAVSDRLVAITNLTDLADVDISSYVTISAANTLTVDGVDLSSKKLQVFWMNTSAG